MRTLSQTAFAAVALALTACAAPKTVEPAAPVFKLSQSYACPYPPHSGLITVAADGKASWIIFEGLEGPPKAKVIRQKKRLSPADIKELAAVMAKSDFKSLPERVQSFPPRHDQTDACSRSLEFSSSGIGKTIRYNDGDVPESLSRLLGEINAVIDRYSWEEDVYPWENPRPPKKPE